MTDALAKVLEKVTEKVTAKEHDTEAGAETIETATQTTEEPKTEKAEETEAKAEPKTRKKPKFIESQTEPATTKQEVKLPEDYEELKKFKSTVESNINWTILKKAEAEGKSILDVTNEIKAQNPSSLTREQVFALMLKDAGISDEDAEDKILAFNEKEFYEQDSIIDKKRTRLNDEYQNKLKEFEKSYQPKQNEQQAYYENLTKVMAEAKGRKFGLDVIEGNDETIARTQTFLKTNPTPEQMFEAMIIYANLEKYATDIWNDGKEYGIAEKIENDTAQHTNNQRGSGMTQSADAAEMVKKLRQQIKTN